MIECVYEIRRDRFARIVRTTIRVAPRDGVVELVFFAFPRREIHAGQELWFGFGGNRAKFFREEHPRGGVPVGRRRQAPNLPQPTPAHARLRQPWLRRVSLPLL